MAPDCEGGQLGASGKGVLVDMMAYLCENDTGVGVFNGGYAAVGVQADVWFLLQVAKVHEGGLVGDTELLKEDGNLPGVGTGGMGVEGDWSSHF